MRRIWFAVVLLGCSSNASSPGIDASGPPPTLDQLVAACAVDDACAIHRGGDHGVDDCLYYFARGRGLLSAADVRCLAAAGGNCDQARACVGLTIISSSSCTANTCENGEVSTCAFNLQILEDCTKLLGALPGSQCLASGQSVKCSLGTCAAGDPDTCEGTIGKRCNAPFVEAVDCAVVGEVCQVINQIAECTGQGPACTKDRVDGPDYVECVVGFEHRVDCAGVVPGGTAQTVTDAMSSTRSFCGTAAACAPWSSTVTCNGSALTVCAFGAVQTLDCTTLGFAGCSGTRCQ